jgi:hypothetical protein
MQPYVRLGIAAVLGLIVAGITLYLFTIESSIGHGLIYVLLPVIITVVSYLGSFGANITISAANCPTDVKKSALNALIPALITLLVSVLFIGIEQFVGLFSFVFNKVGLSFTFNSNWRAESIFGVAFFLFWAAMYGQLISGASAEVC